MSDRESSPDIAARILQHVEELVRLEVALTKAELKEMAINNAIAAGAFAGAGLLAIVALLVAIPVLIVVAVEPHWLAALVWIVVYLIFAAGLALFGRSKFHIGVPQRAVTSFKETRDWAIRQMKSPGR
jgi:uncharacterized membrane protein YqjE